MNTALALVGTAVPIVMSGLFLVSAAKKLSTPRAVAQMVQNVGVPARLAGVITSVLIIAELTAGTAAVWPSTHVIAGVLTAVLGTSFGAAAAVSLRAHRVVLCACFGTSRVPLGMAHILRVPLFWAVGAIQIFTAATWPERLGWSVLAGVTAVMCLAQGVLTGRVVLDGAADRNALSESTNSSVTV